MKRRLFHFIGGGWSAHGGMAKRVRGGGCGRYMWSLSEHILFFFEPEQVPGGQKSLGMGLGKPRAQVRKTFFRFLEV